jgi:hypothetical protein
MIPEEVSPETSEPERAHLPRIDEKQESRTAVTKSSENN